MPALVKVAATRVSAPEARYAVRDFPTISKRRRADDLFWTVKTTRPAGTEARESVMPPFARRTETVVVADRAPTATPTSTAAAAVSEAISASHVQALTGVLIAASGRRTTRRYPAASTLCGADRLASSLGAASGRRSDGRDVGEDIRLVAAADEPGRHHAATRLDLRR